MGVFHDCKLSFLLYPDIHANICIPNNMLELVNYNVYIDNIHIHDHKFDLLNYYLIFQRI